MRSLLAVFISLRLSYSSIEVQTLLWDQELTDDDFNHHPCIKPALAEAVCSVGQECTAVVLGVEYGREVFELVSQGYKVIGVEPLPKFYNVVLKRAIELDLMDNITLWQAAAGSTVGEISISYAEMNILSPVITVDHLIKNTVDVLSIDVHGDASNLDVLKGATQAMRNGLIKSVWIELLPEPWLEELLNLLNTSGFIVFDFRFIGTSVWCQDNAIMASKCKKRLHYSGDRPSDGQYADFMSDLRTRSFQWLQTDIVAIHRDHYNHNVKAHLSRLSIKCPNRFRHSGVESFP